LQFELKDNELKMKQGKERLEFVLIGCGRIAARHVDQINRCGRLVAVCDIDRVKADVFAKKFDALPFYDIKRLLRAVKADVAVICTPNGLHARHSVLSLKHGMHVLCEKPMAIRSRDCKKMISSAVKHKRQLVVVKQNRFNPPVIALKKAIDQGRLGRILSVQVNGFWNRNKDYYQDDWRGTMDLDGGTLYTQFSHFIDLMIWLAGDVKKARTFTANFLHKEVIEFEDTGVAVLEFQNGALGGLHYSVNAHNQNMEGSITVFGEKGTVKVGGRYLNILEYQDIQGFQIENLPESGPANDYGNYKGSMSNHNKVYDSFVKAIRKNEPPPYDMFDGLRTVEVIEKIYKAKSKR
jgi:UDP-N-acetyl-2-amino-2-deoxyglucuronate dehydrogenase